MRRYIPWLGLIGMLVSITVAIYSSVIAAFHPFNQSTADLGWALFYFILIGGAGILYGLKNYRAIIQISVISSLLLLGIVIFFSDNGPALLALVWLLAISAGVGSKLLDFLSLSTQEHPFEKLLLATGLGLGALSILTLALGSAHFLQPYIPRFGRYLNLLHPIPAFAALLILSIWVLPGLIKRLFPLTARGMADFRERYRSNDLRLPSIWIGTLFICGLGIFIWSLSPGIWFDSLVYHLAAPTLYIQNHGIYRVAEPLQFYWAHYGEMLTTLALLIAGQPLTGLISFAVGLITCGMVYLFGRRVAGNRVGAFSALLFYSLPILFVSGIAYNDIVVTLFGFAIIYCLLLWWQEQKLNWLLVSGIFAGLAVGTKYNAAIIILPAALLVVIGLVKHHRVTSHTFISILLFAIPMLLLFLPWAAINWLWIGNPFYPYLTEIFHSSGVPSIGIGSSTFLTRMLNNFFFLPWNLTVHGGTYFIENPGGVTSGLLLLVIPWFYLSPSNRGTFRRLASIGLLFTIVVLGLNIPYSNRVRYLLPLFPLLCVIAGLNLELLTRFISESKWSKTGQSWLTVIALVFIFSTRLDFTTFGWQIPERYPYKVALGLETPSAYLSRTIRSYDALQYLNRTGNGRHLIVSIGDETRAYTSSSISSPFFSNTIPDIISKSISSAELAKNLGEAGFDYLLLDRENIRKFPNNYHFPIIDAPFLQTYTQLEFAQNNIYVYHLYPNGVPPEVQPGKNIITNGDFEKPVSEANPVTWVSSGSPLLDNTGRQSNSGKSAVNVSSRDIFYTTVPVVQGNLYTLTEWIRADSPGQNARLQIMWLTQSGASGKVAIDAIPVTESWEQYDFSVTVPEGVMAARVYVTAHDNSRIWVDDVCLASGQTCQP
jgi:hypothetical protein